MYFHPAEDARQRAADMCAIEVLITANMFNVAEYLPRPITRMGERVCLEINLLSPHRVRQLSRKDFGDTFNQYILCHEKRFFAAARRIKTFRNAHPHPVRALRRPRLLARAPERRRRRYAYAADPGHLATLFQLQPVWETTHKALWNRTEADLINDIKQHVFAAVQAAKLTFLSLRQASPDWYAPYLGQMPDFEK